MGWEGCSWPLSGPITVILFLPRGGSLGGAWGGPGRAWGKMGLGADLEQVLKVWGPVIALLSYTYHPSWFMCDTIAASDNSNGITTDGGWKQYSFDLFRETKEAQSTTFMPQSCLCNYTNL